MNAAQRRLLREEIDRRRRAQLGVDPDQLDRDMLAAKKRAYYERNRERVAEYKRAYRVDATGEMVGPDLIDVAIQARKGASAAVALSKQQALALAEELRRAAS